MIVSGLRAPRALLSILAVCSSTLAASTAFAQEPRPAIRAIRATTPPKIDGRLDDEVWAGKASMVGEDWTSYNPLRGEPAKQTTEVWVAYDESAIYFAFHCLDPEPDRIRSTISRRDNVWNDDWVGLSLDSTASGQIAYHMFVNPSGIQMDALNTSSSGENTSPDWWWYSAGRIDDTGYVVEIKLPLESIRFKGGSDVGMRVLFFRRNSRLGLSWSWPSMQPGKWVFESNTPLVFDELHPRRVLEVIPSATVARNEQRVDGQWLNPDQSENIGASVKYGITSTVTLDATVNPDFSQVESDAFQLLVNRRYPVFFSEKRPFFMEGLGLMNLAGTGGDATMLTAVHTRTIVQPSVGAKLTGTAGDYSFATLSAGDKSVDPGQKMFMIGRGVRNLGQGQYAGVLVTDTEYKAQFNRVIAADVALRHGDHFTWNASALGSDSSDLNGARKRGAGAQGSYSYSTRRWGVSGQAEHYGRDFQMDTAFMNRVGVTRGWLYGDVSFYPTGKYGWIRRVSPFVWHTAAYDDVEGGPERFSIVGIRGNFTRQGYIRLDLGTGNETFASQRFETGRRHIDGNAQVLRWLNVGGGVQNGPAVYYDPAAPYQGDARSYWVNVGLQPTSRFNQSLAYSYNAFDRRSTGEQVYGVHILNLRDTYQFTPQFLVRAITQFDSSQRRILGDFLASYELTPGTVVHVGYSSIFERDFFHDYRATARGFFFKASYLARL
jgi:hypothetical protein